MTNAGTEGAPGVPQVVLVDVHDNPLGLAEKMQAHRGAGLLHRALSVFIVNRGGEMLLQRRARHKYHSAQLWSNACCSHPESGVPPVVAAQARLAEELGFTTPLLPAGTVSYRVDLGNGMTEWELDHLFVGEYSGTVQPNPREVDAIDWVRWEDLQARLRARPGDYTPWFPIVLAALLRNAGQRLWWCQVRPGTVDSREAKGAAPGRAAGQ